MPLANLEALSDDEAVVLADASEAAVLPSSGSRKRSRPGDRSVVSFSQALALKQQLRRAVQSTCRCCRKASPKSLDKLNCLAPFREGDMFEQALQVRKLLVSMCKEDADNKVFELCT